MKKFCTNTIIQNKKSKGQSSHTKDFRKGLDLFSLFYYGIRSELASYEWKKFEKNLINSLSLQISKKIDEDLLKDIDRPRIR